MSIYTLGLVIVLVFVQLLYLKFAQKLRIYDLPKDRSSHEIPTINSGGIIFPLAFILGQFQGNILPIWVNGSLLILSFLSFWDDLRPISSWLKLFIQTSVLALFCYFQLWDIVSFSIWFAILFVAIGIINAFNFMDGINGMLGFYSIVVLLVLLITNYFIPLYSWELIVLLISSLIIFGYYNFRKKAICFSGDVGSVSLGFIVIYFLSTAIVQTNHISFLLFVLVFGVDTFYTMIFRAFQGQNLFEAHRLHLYQFLTNELKISHLKVSAYYSITQLSISAIVLLNILYFKINEWSLIFIFFVISSFCYYLIKRFTKLNSLNS